MKKDGLIKTEAAQGITAMATSVASTDSVNATVPLVGITEPGLPVFWLP